jgi:hypothetical protein
MINKNRETRASLWVPETMHTGLDLLLRRWLSNGMISRWRCS